MITIFFSQDHCQLLAFCEFSGLLLDLDSLSLWSLTKAFNGAKCVLLSFTHGSAPPPHLNLVFPLVNSTHDLGVLITDTLSWSDHIHLITSKAYKMLGLIRRGFSNTLLSLTKNRYMSHLWNLTCCTVQSSGEHLRKDIMLLERVQRRASFILRDYPVFGTVCLFLTKRFLRRQQYLLSKITFGLISLNITTLLIHALFTYHVHVLTVSLLSLTVPIFRLSHCWGSPSVTLFLFITYYCVYCKARNNNNNLSHNCQDMATLEELAVHLSHNCRDMATVEELAVNLSYNCRDMATVEELAVDNSHNFQDKLPGRARR